MIHIDPSIKIGSRTLPFPVLTASGTFGYGEEYKDVCDYHKLGAIVCKTVTRHARQGNPPPRIVETELGMLNSIGLANEGIEYFSEHILPYIAEYPCPYIVNIAGSSKEEFLELITSLEAKSSKIWGWELNLSCPNVSGGSNFGKDPKRIYEIVNFIRPHTALPLLIKIPPNVSDVSVLGRAAQDAGADAISAFNTFLGMRIDIKRGKAILHRKTGGYSGTGIFPASLALVYALAQEITIPIIAIGGITHGNHALQYLMAGASAVQIGSANFRNPQTANIVLAEIMEYCSSQKLSRVTDIPKLS